MDCQGGQRKLLETPLGAVGEGRLCAWHGPLPPLGARLPLSPRSCEHSAAATSRQPGVEVTACPFYVVCSVSGHAGNKQSRALKT